MYIIAFLLYFFAFLRKNIKLRNKGNVAFIFLFQISTLYYGVLSNWYWVTFKDGYFLGVNWRNDVAHIYIYYILVAILVNFLIIVLDKKEYRLSFSKEPKSFTLLFKIVFITVFVFGLFSCVYVFKIGSTYGLKSNNSSFLLILYQFSDILIPSILFIYSKYKYKNIAIFLVLVFIAYASFVGLRYKIALILFPIIISLYLDNEIQFKKKFQASIAFLIVIFWFSIMTISRQKFSGVDVDKVKGTDFESLLYGLFADTNSIFGLASAFKNFNERFDYVYLTPIFEIFTQFIPRFIFPEKDLYNHLGDISYGIALNSHSESSGTTVPFFGEWYVMFGPIGIIVGCLFYVYSFYYLRKLLEVCTCCKNEYIVGISLLVTFVCYYYYSRGSVAQISKGLLFAVLPYYYFCYLKNRKIKIS